MKYSRKEAGGERYVYGDAWEATGQLLVYPNGVDLEIVTAKRPFLYEGACYESLVRRFPGLFVVGPHLSDYILSRQQPWQSYIRPDTFLLSLADSTFSLAGLVEIKLGSTDLERKLSGFKVFLEALRREPNFFLAALAEAIGECVDLPSKLIIPPDHELVVYFMTSHPNGILFTGGETLFQLVHLFEPDKSKRRKRGRF